MNIRKGHTVASYSSQYDMELNDMELNDMSLNKHSNSTKTRKYSYLIKFILIAILFTGIIFTNHSMLDSHSSKSKSMIPDSGKFVNDKLVNNSNSVEYLIFESKFF